MQKLDPTQKRKKQTAKDLKLVVFRRDFQKRISQILNSNTKIPKMSFPRIWKEGEEALKAQVARIGVLGEWTESTINSERVLKFTVESRIF